MFLSPHLLRLATDARLVALVRERNPAAFEAVYNRHHRAILSFCRHMLGDPQEAEDAVQQTFLAAYSDLISTDKPIHLRPWLFTIARNRCYTLLRGRREQPTSELEETVTEGLASQVQRREDLRELVVDLRRLPDEQRAALVLAELDSLSHEEIAIALGVPREKVKALVFQARESLVASRTARETDCADIREQLATQRGGALRRGNLRRHLRECAGCRDFRRQVEHQRRQLAALLPVVPTVALKEGVLGGTIGGGAAASVGTGGMIVSTALKSGLAKGALGALLAGAGAAGTIVATHGFQAPARQSADAAGLPSTGGTTTSASRTIAEEAKAASVSQAGSYAAASSSSSTPASGGAGLTALSSATSVYGSPSASFIRTVTGLSPFSPLLGIPKVLSGGTVPRSPVPAAPATPTGSSAVPVTAAPPGSPTTSTPTATNPGTTSPTSGTTHHYPATTPTGTNRGTGSSNGSSSHAGSVGAQKGGGDGGSGYPTSGRHDRVGLRWLHTRSGSRRHGEHRQHGQHGQHRQHRHTGTPATPGPRATPATRARAEAATPPAAATRGRRRARAAPAIPGPRRAMEAWTGPAPAPRRRRTSAAPGRRATPAAETAVSVPTTTVSTVRAGTTRGETAADTVIQ